jgi:hypothetical protein
MPKDKTELVLSLEQRQQMLEAVRLRTAAATRAVQAASRALTDLKRATKAAQLLGEEKMRESRARSIMTPETNTSADKPSSLPNGRDSTH